LSSRTGGRRALCSDIMCSLDVYRDASYPSFGACPIRQGPTTASRHTRHYVRVTDESDDYDPEVDAVQCDSTPSLRGELSASCLCYLFADLFLPPLSRRDRFRGVPGIEVPSSDSLVGIGLLEAELLAVALWDLRA